MQSIRDFVTFLWFYLQFSQYLLAGKLVFLVTSYSYVFHPQFEHLTVQSIKKVQQTTGGKTLISLLLSANN